jgi:hypothetical protein
MTGACSLSLNSVVADVAAARQPTSGVSSLDLAGLASAGSALSFEEEVAALERVWLQLPGATAGRGIRKNASAFCVAAASETQFASSSSSISST